MRDNNRMTHSKEETPPERPVVLDRITREQGRILYRFAFDGQPYELEGPELSPGDFTAWLTGYAAATPRCACCDRIIFPGSAITVGHVRPDDSGYSHLSDECNPTAEGFAGSFDSDGRLCTPWPTERVVQEPPA